MEEAEQQRNSREELVPRIKCIQEILTLTKKLRLFFGVYFFTCILLIILFSANHMFGVAGTILLSAVSIFFAKKENDYIDHLSKTYGVG